MHLDEAQVSRYLDIKQLVPALEAAFRDRYPHIVLPDRTHAKTNRGIFLTMSCYDAKADSLGMKLVTVCRDAQPSVQATYLLLDSGTSRIRTILPANRLTEIRTAATSALATLSLARSDSSTLAIFGTGRQAQSHLEVFSRLFEYKGILVCGSTPQKSESFARLNDSFPVRTADAYTCVTQADVICACTNSSDPLFDGKLLKPGTHLNLVGSFQPGSREVDSISIARARVYVDTYESAFAEAGDILIPIEEGLISREHVVSDLHELVSRQRSGRTNAHDITIFKSVGCALEDLVAAELVEQAARGTLGRPL